nr:transposase [uncultured Roseateles sp.]
MARLPRLVLGGQAHHVIQRGHNRQPVFLEDQDRRKYLEFLREVSATCKVAIHAYVLMDNHVHLLVTPEEADGISRMMQAQGRRYVAWFNHRHGRSGTLWEGRFRASLIDSERYFMTCMRYIDLNPVRAGLVAQCQDFAWSSHGHYIGQRSDTVITEHPLFWALGNTPFERDAAYKALFDTELSAGDEKALTDAALKGWPLGSADFLAQLAGQTDRPLQARKRGRPPAAASKLQTRVELKNDSDPI